MTIGEIREKILSEDTDFILSEHKKLRQLYALKTEIRYERTRNTEFATESVAEHIYGMHCLCDYFLPLIQELQDADVNKIRLMIQYHDIDEIETGDLPCYEKGDLENEELQASLSVIQNLPEHMQEELAAALREYHAQETPEAQFAKALDKAEPALQCYDKDMKKVLHENKVSLAMGMAGGKADYMAKFPIILHFNNVIAAQMTKEGFFDKGK